jgi:hypothetical protein
MAKKFKRLVLTIALSSSWSVVHGSSYRPVPKSNPEFNIEDAKNLNHARHVYKSTAILSTTKCLDVAEVPDIIRNIPSR